MPPRKNKIFDSTADVILRASEKINEPSRSLLRKFLTRLADSSQKAAVECAGCASVLQQLGSSQQHFLLSQSMSLLDLPEAAAEFFCSSGRLLQALDENSLRSWIEEGKAIGRKNPRAAAAFFRQESLAGATAVQRLQRSVRIAEVSRVLQLYSNAVAGKALGVKSTADAPGELVREGHHLPLTDGRNIYLPDQSDRHSSRGENFDEYKVLAAHQAGYIEFGTFDLDIDVLLDHPALSVPALHDIFAGSGAVASHYEIFFRLFRDEQLARDIFFAVEDGRVDYRLCAQYRGLAGILRKAASDSLRERPEPSSLPLREALVESLIRLSISGRVDEPPREELLPLYNYICRNFSRVLSRNATVTDSALAAARIYSAIGGLPNISPGHPLSPAAIEKIQHLPAGQAQDSAASECGHGEDEKDPYRRARPTSYRGQTRPELVQLELAIDLLKEADAEGEEGAALSREMLEELMRRGAKIKITQMTAKELAEASSLFVTDLKGILQEKLKELTPEERKQLGKLLQSVSVASPDDSAAARVYFYDEWDYLIGDYRPRWCRLREVAVEAGSGEVVARIQKERSALISAVKRHFQRIRPEMLRRVKRLRSGEEIELDDAIEAVIDRKAGLTPSDRVYQKRDRRARDVATCFLLDLSASTDEWIVEEPGSRQVPSARGASTSLFPFFSRGAPEELVEEFRPPQEAKRVIDIEREALVIMAEALESLGDEYSIYGFSGYGRENVEFFTIKGFSEKYSDRARCRIGALKPRKSTRMGPAIRHALEKLAGTGCRLKVLILLSDGYPQDFDYGPDRSSRDYGLHDTMVALQEARKKNVHTFCVTVDQAGNDYLSEMCGGENYLVVRKPSSLPRILPRIYRGLTV